MKNTINILINMPKLIYSLIILCIVILMSGCANNRGINDIEDLDARMRMQDCARIYCEDTEDSLIKFGALKVLEGGAAIYGIDLDLGKGACSQFYDRRAPANGYLDMARKPEQRCGYEEPELDDDGFPVNNGKQE